MIRQGQAGSILDDLQLMSNTEKYRSKHSRAPNFRTAEVWILQTFFWTFFFTFQPHLKHTMNFTVKLGTPEAANGRSNRSNSQRACTGHVWEPLVKLSVLSLQSQIGFRVINVSACVFCFFFRKKRFLFTWCETITVLVCSFGFKWNFPPASLSANTAISSSDVRRLPSIWCRIVTTVWFQHATHPAPPVVRSFRFCPSAGLSNCFGFSDFQNKINKLLPHAESLCVNAQLIASQRRKVNDRSGAVIFLFPKWFRAVPVESSQLWFASLVERSPNSKRFAIQSLDYQHHHLNCQRPSDLVQVIRITTLHNSEF